MLYDLVKWDKLYFFDFKRIIVFESRLESFKFDD